MAQLTFACMLCSASAAFDGDDALADGVRWDAAHQARHAAGAPETVEPFLVPPGWVDSDFIAHPGGPTYRLLTYPDGMVRFEHRCNRGARGTIICAPALDPSHVITRGEVTRDSRRGTPTVTPSILCPDCGTHGFITDGRWRG